MSEQPKGFYVDLMRDGRVALLAGPFVSESVARQYEKAAVAKANEVDPWSHFDPYGVVGVDLGMHAKPGKLNHLIEIDPADLVNVEAQRAAN